MSDKMLSCAEATALFQSGKVHLTEPAPFQTSLSAELKFTGFDGATIAFTTDKLSTTNYGPVSPAEMPKKDTFPLLSNTKLNVSVVPNKDLTDMCNAAQEFIINAIESKRSLVSLFLSFSNLTSFLSLPLSFYPTSLTLSYLSLTLSYLSHSIKPRTSL
jgi:hypothetical protein